MGENERITRRNPEGGISVVNLPAALERLADYEDAEEQGRLVRLPFSIGQTVYVIFLGRVEELTVSGYRIKEGDMFFEDDFGDYWGSRYTHVGNGVFGTRAEAEAALRTRVAAQ